MSNCITPIDDEAVLLPEYVDTTKLKEVSDVDGNTIYYDSDTDEWVLKMAHMTTIREWRHFLWEHVQPAVKTKDLKIDFRVKEESDGFGAIFIWPVTFLPPGTQKTNENWRSIFQ